MGKEADAGEKEVRAAREVMGRAIRRLDALEYVILFAAVILAMGGGAVVGWLLSSSFGVPFRWGWAGASLLLFLLPGGFVYLRELRPRRRPPERDAGSDPSPGEDPGDATSTRKGPHG